MEKTDGEIASLYEDEQQEALERWRGHFYTGGDIHASGVDPALFFPWWDSIPYPDPNAPGM